MPHDRAGRDHREHDHGHAHGPPSNNMAFAVGIGLNVTFVVIEVVYGIVAQSLALLADAGHNLSDVLSLLIAWGAVYLAKASPTKHRTYGLRRSSILAALTNAIVLLVVVGGIVWEAIQRIGEPATVEGDTVMWVAAAGILVNGVSALFFMAGRKGDLNVRGAFVHLAADAAVSAGVVIAGLVIVATGWDWVDPAVSIVIAIVIVLATWGLLRESVNLAMDAVPENIDPHAVEEYLTALPGVAALHDLHIWAMSTTETALTAHLVMPTPPATDKFVVDLAHALQSRFSIGHVTVQIEHGDDDLACKQEPAHVV